MNKDLHDYPVQFVKGIGPGKAKLLARLGIETVADALYHIPHRYEDRRLNCRIADLRYELLQSVTGRVISADIIKTPRKNMKIFELVVADETGILRAKWFNQPYMKKLFSPGRTVILSGIVRRDPYSGAGLEMQNPDYEIPGKEHERDSIHTLRIVPIYRTTAGLGLRALRAMMYNIVEVASSRLAECMPEEILKRYDLLPVNEVFKCIHFPPAEADLDDLNRGVSACHRRLAFEEFFLLQTGLAVIKKGRGGEKGISFRAGGKLVKRLEEMLPFRLTNAQQRVFAEIQADMRSPGPMNRLLQGDVGSGKTIVALKAMLVAVESGYQAALMAPTEILSEQHYLNVRSLTEKLGLRCVLLTGSKKERPLQEIESGDVHIIIGTHALIQENVRFHKLGLVVIDEQHRFGVMQRAMLRKKGLNPDVLVMTATPIPRTLSLTLYGDLDCSVIDELPPRRKQVITRLFREGDKRKLYGLIRSEIKKGRQAYIVYPLIEESEKMLLRSAIPGKEAFEKIFPDFRTGLIHGRMKPDEREEIMQSFKNGELDILVSTTVIEVGVDVPNASLMLIVHAERFGLSQLHQLRGRVGRGAHQSYCFLLAYGKLSDEARRRLDVMAGHTDGFRIAEEDFILRGPGEFFGTRQSGMPDLKVANMIRDARLLSMARKESFKIIEQDPDLSGYPVLRDRVERFWHGKIEMFRTS
ncbi:ATP-dependent DNA helicase RecG [hydrothermal vent metagenome]|uniref:ATP-dependent DNA helicase RecG n=1 Tax=hydrothermal vent metagenome TaxID=652676 RepID=A0A3B1CJB5_9ZZZZ